MIQDEIRKSLKEALRKLDVSVDDSEIVVEHPAVKGHGDYASNIAMRLSSKMKKPPLKIAEEIVGVLKTSESVSKAQALKPGFINFFLSDKFLWEETIKVLTEKENYGAPLSQERKRVLIEHTQVNPNKEPHVGHLRNTCIGDALARLYRLSGDDVKVLYYQNDVGQQIASILLALKKQFVNKGDFPSIIKWAGVAYADIESRMEVDENLRKEKEAIQLKIAEQDTEEARLAHETTTEILKETLKILSDLNIEYDLIVEESDILQNKLWEKTFALLQTKESFYKAEEGDKKGCWLIKMSDAEDKIIVRSNGIPTYAGNDIANHLWKFGILEDFKYVTANWGTQTSPLYVTEIEGGQKMDIFSPADSIVNVTDQTQTYPQQSVIESLRVLGYKKEAENYHHVNYGFVYLSRKTAEKLGIPIEEGAEQVKISGRKGAVVSVSNFLSEMEKALKEKYAESETTKEVRDGAIKFEMLKYNTYQDIVFDLDSALDLRGFSGPYVQYAYTRANAILAKDDAGKNILDPSELSLEEKERPILRMLSRYPEVTASARKEHAPHQICLYLFELSQSFNSFYESNRIIGSDRERERLSITEAVAQVFKNGLNVLGITAPNKM